MQKIFHVQNELLADGLVQIVALVQRLDRRRAQRFLPVERSARDGVHDEKCDGTYDKYSQNGK